MKILIADDETPIREWIQFSIERGNDPDFEIVGVAENGSEALELALMHRVDTVITDIKMPGMDGLMLMKKLLPDMPYVSFIILTNYAEFSYAREAITFGAKKYFLKSELRGQDILEALFEIRENNAKLLVGKEEDCYSNGYLDIFSCCYRIDDAAFVQEFWRRHYFRDDMSFLVLAVKSRDCREQKVRLHAFIKEEGIHILRPILRNESIYIIMQAKQAEELSRSAEKFWEFWKRQEPGVVVSGRILTGIGQVMDGIEEAERMLQYGFFYEEGYFQAEAAENQDRLQREKIKKGYHKLLNSFLHEDEETLRQNVEQWFSFFGGISFQDVGWAKETCINLAMRIEEIFQEHSSNYLEAQEVDRDWTIGKCRDFCKGFIKELYSKGDFDYSQSVREAVKYIHKNYADQDISLKLVAQSIYRSPEYLSRLFKLETGKNFSIYLMHCRLNHANELLLHSDMKIYEIAYAVGYTTPSYFSKVYHEYMGVTPEMARGQDSDRKSE